MACVHAPGDIPIGDDGVPPLEQHHRLGLSGQPGARGAAAVKILVDGRGLGLLLVAQRPREGSEFPGVWGQDGRPAGGAAVDNPAQQLRILRRQLQRRGVQQQGFGLAHQPVQDVQRFRRVFVDPGACDPGLHPPGLLRAWGADHLRQGQGDQAWVHGACVAHHRSGGFHRRLERQQRGPRERIGACENAHHTGVLILQWLRGGPDLPGRDQAIACGEQLAGRGVVQKIRHGAKLLCGDGKRSG
ncbi:hypothetical protein HMPREF3088_02895 [Corynebacterium sp. HMSC22B11]|nr:hypothetical protein HMPREF3088_02895 [Corynebacterium sp. HMSC22B11]